MEKTKKILSCWPFHLTILVVVMACEAVNTISIPVGTGSIMFLPMLFAMVIGLLLFLAKPVKFIKQKESILSNKFVVIGIGIFLAKVAVTSGTQLPQVLAAGPALILQEFGNLGTIVLALPFALLLGHVTPPPSARCCSSRWPR